MNEIGIQTIIFMARTFIVHLSLHWSEHGFNDLVLWVFAVKHAACYTINVHTELVDFSIGIDHQK